MARCSRRTFAVGWQCHTHVETPLSCPGPERSRRGPYWPPEENSQGYEASTGNISSCGKVERMKFYYTDRGCGSFYEPLPDHFLGCKEEIYLSLLLVKTPALTRCANSRRCSRWQREGLACSWPSLGLKDFVRPAAGLIPPEGICQ